VSEVLFDGLLGVGLEITADPQGEAVLDLQADVGAVLHSKASS
jgi:hypothetical protein